MVDTLMVTRVIIILGIINLVAGLLIFLSCRCIPGWRASGWLMKYQWYQRFFRYHCYIWLAFWPSVAAHAVLVILFLGWPA